MPSAGRVYSPMIFGGALSAMQKVRVLDYEQRGFLQSMGNPSYRTMPNGKTLRDAYSMLYAGRRDYDETMDQEEVTHLLGLYVHS